MPTYRTKEPIVIRKFRGGSNQDYPEFTLPVGLRCKPTGAPGKFWVDQFPPDIFPSGSGIRHDATHYGIILDEACVETTPDIVPEEKDWHTNKTLTPDAIRAAAVVARVPYATSKISGKLLVLYICISGGYAIEYDGEAFWSGYDVTSAIHMFRTFKPATPTS